MTSSPRIRNFPVAIVSGVLLCATLLAFFIQISYVGENFYRALTLSMTLDDISLFITYVFLCCEVAGLVFTVISAIRGTTSFRIFAPLTCGVFLLSEFLTVIIGLHLAKQYDFPSYFWITIKWRVLGIESIFYPSIGYVPKPLAFGTLLGGLITNILVIILFILALMSRKQAHVALPIAGTHIAFAAKPPLGVGSVATNKFCTACGAAAALSSAFCGKCGASLS
jgi:hypothetical protein